MSTAGQHCSATISILLLFLTHGLVNSALLSSLNPLRCVYINVWKCTADQTWALNWLSLGHFHVHVLIVALAKAANGHVLLESRLVILSAAVILTYLASGIFMLEYLNPSMAVFQSVIYMGFLAYALWQIATALPVIPLPIQLRTNSFDRRRKLPVSTIAVAVHCVLSAVRLVDIVFGDGNNAYIGDSTGPIFQNVLKAFSLEMLWVTVILAASTILTSTEQQKSLLVGHAAVLFLTQIMLAGKQGEQMEKSQLDACGIGNFFSILIALFGAL
jgi:hypothetical protein